MSFNTHDWKDKIIPATFFFAALALGYGLIKVHLW